MDAGTGEEAAWVDWGGQCWVKATWIQDCGERAHLESQMPVFPPGDGRKGEDGRIGPGTRGRDRMWAATKCSEWV